MPSRRLDEDRIPTAPIEDIPPEDIYLSTRGDFGLAYETLVRARTAGKISGRLEAQRDFNLQRWAWWRGFVQGLTLAMLVLGVITITFITIKENNNSKWHSQTPTSTTTKTADQKAASPKKQ